MAEMPPLEEFSHLTEAQSATRFAESQNHIVYRTLIADTQTAVGAMMKLADGQDYHCLLESVEGGEVRGRYSVIGLKPDLLWRCSGNKVEINRQAETDLTAFSPDDQLPLVSLRALMKESEMPNTAPLPPMASGLFGYLGYDMIRHVEKVPENNPDLLGVFDTVLMRPSVIAIFDRLKDSISLAVPIRPASWASPTEAWNDAQARLDETEERLYDAIPHSYEQPADTPDIIPQSNVSQNRFYEMVKKARNYITAGDIFQVVLSQRFSFPFTLPTFTFYRSLRRLNPSPFLFHFALGDVSIVGSSPEILVRLRGGEVTIRPIAGTRPRGATPEEDAAHA
ncbi:MAG: chorismate-binding protein, partial [Alphaproteobacteria bacterium]|nr:chorismate-binding protein [Alphaproteobacteria bacterium]